MARKRWRQRSPRTREVILKHARRRAYERYGLNLSFNDIEQMSSMIRAGEAELIERRKYVKTSVWRLVWDGIEVLAAYRKGRGVVTFFKEDHED